jgi:hypothetical protein
VPLHRVTWEIDIEADNAREAARKALQIQQKPDSTATVFKVTDPDGKVADFDLVRPRTKANRRPVRTAEPT